MSCRRAVVTSSEQNIIFRQSSPPTAKHSTTHPDMMPSFGYQMFGYTSRLVIYPTTVNWSLVVCGSSSCAVGCRRTVVDPSSCAIVSFGGTMQKTAIACGHRSAGRVCTNNKTKGGPFGMLSWIHPATYSDCKRPGILVTMCGLLLRAHCRAVDDPNRRVIVLLSCCRAIVLTAVVVPSSTRAVVCCVPSCMPLCHHLALVS